MMQELMALLTEHGVMLVFANVLAEQLGAPIPAVPLLVVAVALAAALAADTVWYLAGRRHGHRVLKTVCRISISPDSCVRQTEDFFERWGATTLVFAKFIPGLSTVAAPLAGAMSIGWGRFLAWNGIGALLWAGLSIGAGLLFHAQVDALLGALE